MRQRNFIQQQFRTFALTVAVIVTMCALNSSAYARIIYHPVNIYIDDFTYNLDLNGDGVDDFSITSYEDFSQYECAGGAFVTETSATGNGTIFGPMHFGNPIGPKQVFGGDGVLEAIYYTNGICWLQRNGPWIGAKSGYLGFSLQVEGKTYYGWAKLINVKVTRDVVVRLVGYAYENIAGKAIAAGHEK